MEAEISSILQSDTWKTVSRRDPRLRGVAWRGQNLFDEFKTKFRQAFRASHLGKLDWFLGMGIDQHEDFSVDINQTAYIEKMPYDDHFPIHFSLACLFVILTV